ncbi:ABC-three component system middle component 7 [Piscibacillus salipiscarius]|uniref:ABC-three component system middle component 7 n=1 Tax=Piscibacillus salipiscarius TaxID=299480 RepID=A0ABW5Q6W8_9BACI|nr:ABC-three component system middle component 7 [Piscibacillus salipiscarius]
MLLPSKVTRFSESVIGKITILLEYLVDGEITIKDLYYSTRDQFEEIDEFIYSLDVLYLLDAVKVDFDKGVVSYVNKN